MYTNPSNIVKTEISLLQRNNLSINSIVRQYQSNRKLTVLEGMRNTLPADAYPSFEIEPGTGTNQWATTRAQRPRYDFTCTLTVKVDNPNYGVEYITTLATSICEIMTSPENLQLRILNETHWDSEGGLVDTYMLDSLVENLNYSSLKEGSVRTAEFSWFVLVHEPYPESKWRIGDGNLPSILRPRIIAA